MDVSYSNSVTNTIKSLRENIYSKDEFKESFANSLQTNIGATDINFIPDQLGGWAVAINTSPDESVKESSSYVSKITDILVSTIHGIDRKSSVKNVACNLANVIVAGPGNIVVKL